MSNTIKWKYIALILVLLFFSSLTHLQRVESTTEMHCDHGVSLVIRSTVKFVNALGMFTALNIPTVSKTANEHTPLTQVESCLILCQIGRHHAQTYRHTLPALCTSLSVPLPICLHYGITPSKERLRGTPSIRIRIRP